MSIPRLTRIHRATGRAFFLGVLVTALCVGLLGGVLYGQESSADRDESEVVVALQRETELFCARDLQAWARYWRQAPTTTKAYLGGDAPQVLQGWPAVHQYAVDYLAAHPGPITVPEANPDYAFDFLADDVVNVRYSYDGSAGRVHESRLLVREGGQWRIARMTTVKP